MNGISVGKLTRKASGILEFAYDGAWIQSDRGRPVSLSLPLANHPYRGDVVEHFFDNLLPENQALRNAIMKRFGAESNRAFDLLRHTGRDCVGAIQLLPEDHSPVDIQTVHAAKINDRQIGEILKHLGTMPLGMGDIDDFRLSLAGVQEKTALLFRDGLWHRPLGSTPSSHILKRSMGILSPLGLDLSDSIENEWLCHLILKTYGLPVADCEPVCFDGENALVIARFDRRWSEDRSWLIRLPQEDMCQALGVHPVLKYEADGGVGIKTIMDLLLGSSNAMEDRRTFMKTQVMFWLLGAIDGHAKNFSVYLLPSGCFQLTPLYDVLSAHPLVADRLIPIQKLRMAMAALGKNKHYHWQDIHRRHWMSTARACRFPVADMETILKEFLDSMDQVIHRVGAMLPPGFPDRVAQTVFTGMKKARDRMA